MLILFIVFEQINIFLFSCLFSQINAGYKKRSLINYETAYIEKEKNRYRVIIRIIYFVRFSI